MALIDAGLEVELDWLLALPLDGEALVTLWSAIETDLAAVAPQTPATRAARAALKDARRTQQLLNLRGRCLDGDWLTALPSFIAQLSEEAPPVASEDTAWGLELLLELHYILLDPNAPAWELTDAERADLLWQAHALLERLEPRLQSLCGETPERLPVVIEQISRYGAIAWMSRQGAMARERAIRLLLRLAWVNPDSHPWSLPALRERISATPLEQPAGAAPEATAAELHARWSEAWLGQAITALADLEPQLHTWDIARLETMPTGDDDRDSGGIEGSGAREESAPADTAPMDGRIRLDLERLQGLPIDLPSRLTLWRALRTHQGCPPPARKAPEAEALDVELRRLLLADQQSRCREQALGGDWPEAARRLASLLEEAEALNQTDALAGLLAELQGLLSRETEGPAAPSPTALHPDDRAELLWQAHRWQQLIHARGPGGEEHLSGIGEPITRLGAIAWLERLRQAREPAEQLRALIRSQTCLIALAQRPQACPDWVTTALRDGLRTGLNWLGRGLGAADLLQWSEIYVERALPDAQRRQAQPLLWPAQAALEVGRALRLEPFHTSGDPSPGRSRPGEVTAR